MSSYQRYLREKKEVEIEEQDLEEVVIKGFGDIDTNKPPVRGKVQLGNPKSSPATTTAKAAPAASKPAPVNALAALNAPSKSDATQSAPATTVSRPSSNATDKKEKQKQVLQGLKDKNVSNLTQNEIEQYRNLSSKLGEPVPDAINKRERELKKSASPSSTPAADTSATDSIAPESTGSEISGNNISEILASGGITNPRTIQRVKSAFQQAARSLGVQIKPGFDA